MSYNPSYVQQLEEQNAKLKAAVMVFVLSPNIRQWLKDNDPKALEQARKALNLDELINRMVSREEADDFAALFLPPENP